MARASILRSSMRYRITPGSSAPQRVPIGSPSTAVKPIVRRHAASGLHRAHARAVAEMQHDRPARGRGRIQVREHGGDVLVGQAVEAVPLHAGVVERGPAARIAGRRRDSSGGRTCRSRRPAGDPARAPAGVRWATGCAAGAAARAGRSARAPERLGVAPAPEPCNSRPPWTTRWPTPTRRCAPRRSSGSR